MLLSQNLNVADTRLMLSNYKDLQMQLDWLQNSIDIVGNLIIVNNSIINSDDKEILCVIIIIKSKRTIFDVLVKT